MTIKTRFAPSPTGSLHIGGVRTALYSWLYAKQKQGEFILRIEDTDQQRSTKESVDVILQGMAWLGLDYDHPPIFQTERYERYNELAHQLIAEGKAYRCTCTPERLETLREAQVLAKEKPRYDHHCRELALEATNEPFVIRFKNPLDGNVRFVDEVYGEIIVNNCELNDLILIRGDGNPTYNFAVVIDDWDMGITHVIRGDDHINNTPRQINLFNAFNAPIPIFAHLPMILGEDGKRLSKRHGAVSVLDFKANGVLPEALLNYLVRLGWSHGDQEIFSLAEMIQYFDLAHISRGAAHFNYEKLFWLNQHYMKTLPAARLIEPLEECFAALGINIEQGPPLEAVIDAQKERCKTLVELAEKSAYFYQDNLSYDEDAVKKHLRPVILEPLVALLTILSEESNWTAAIIHQHLEQVSTSFAINLGKIGQPLRVAVTGSGMSPSIDITVAMIGQKRTLARMASAIDRIKARAAAVDAS